MEGGDDPEQRSYRSRQNKGKENASKWIGSSLRKWGLRIGTSAYEVIESLLNGAKYEQQSYRTCLAVLALSKAYSESLLELACKETIADGGVSFKQIKTKIKLLSKLPTHYKVKRKSRREQW